MNSTIKPSACKTCGSPFHSAMYHNPRKAVAVNKPLKQSRKRIRQVGKRTEAYNKWRDEIARPYLVATTFGEVCSTVDCYATEGLEVDHILGRGSHPELKMVLSNVQLLCHNCHQIKTDRIHV